MSVNELLAIAGLFLFVFFAVIFIVESLNKRDWKWGLQVAASVVGFILALIVALNALIAVGAWLLEVVP